MQVLARAVLRPALLAGRPGVEAAAAAACVSAASLTPRPVIASLRHWSSAPSEDALRKAERMVDVMSQSPAMQQMMLGAMPAPLRNPDVLKQLFADPAMRRKIAEMIAAKGISIPDQLLDRMNPASMDETFSRAARLGMDPGQLFQRLMAHPGLLSQLQQPRFMSAFLDIAEDPARQAKYESDPEVLEVVFKVREIMGSTKSPAATTADAAPAAAIPAAAIPVAAEAPIAMGAGEAPAAAPAQPPPPGQAARSEAAAAESAPAPGSSEAAAATSSTAAAPETSSSAAATSASSAEPEPDFNPLIALMRSDPKAAKWLDNPKVMAALQEVQKSPWKTMKYVFNRDVMAAFKDLKDLMAGKKL